MHGKCARTRTEHVHVLGVVERVWEDTNSEQAWKVYEMMKEKNIECNIYTYTALITAFQKTQEQDKVDQVYSDLKESGIEIDSITYAAMLAALEKSGGSGARRRR